VYVLDSDVLTIISGSRRFPNVSSWYDSLDETQIFLSVIAIMEKSKGAAKAVKKGDAATAARVERTLADLKRNFADRILAIDMEAAEDWGRMLGVQDKHVNDAAIAAVAKRHRFMVATRNVSDYVGRGAIVINPYANPPVITRPT
jgi:predicted nucleic acid-binding protein